jgi:hypothetical protein
MKLSSLSGLPKRLKEVNLKVFAIGWQPYLCVIYMIPRGREIYIVDFCRNDQDPVTICSRVGLTGGTILDDLMPEGGFLTRGKMSPKPSGVRERKVNETNEYTAGVPNGLKKTEVCNVYFPPPVESSMICLQLDRRRQTDT